MQNIIKNKYILNLINISSAGTLYKRICLRGNSFVSDLLTYKMIRSYGYINSDADISLGLRIVLDKIGRY